jgi:hypothetical protein
MKSVPKTGSESATERHRTGIAEKRWEMQPGPGSVSDL